MQRLCLLALLAVVHRCLSLEPFSNSRYFSAGKVATLPQTLDVSTSAGLAALAGRAYRPADSQGRSELILFQFEGALGDRRRAYQASWLDFAVAMSWTLTERGLHHFAAVGGQRSDCVALLEAWKLFPALPVPACVVHPPPGDTVEALWVARWTLLAALVSLGTVNVLLVDADTVFHRDPYAELHAPCLAAAQLVLLQDRGWEPNGGWLYVQGALPGGPVHWVTSQVARRYALFSAQRAATGRWPGRTMDQIALQNAVRVAASANGSAWDFAGGGAWQAEFADHPLWREHPPEPQGMNRLAPTGETRRPLPQDCPSAQVREAELGPPTERTLARLVRDVGLPLQTDGLYALRVPTDAGSGWDARLEEALVWAPASVVLLGALIHLGSWVQPPVEAMTHLMAARGTWMATREAAAEDVGHSARIGVMQAHGLWPPQLSLARTATVRLLFLSPRLVELAAQRNSATRLRRLVARAMVAAVNSSRLLVLPEVSCDSPWIGRSAAAVHGLDEPRILVVPPEPGARDVRCFLGGGSGSSCRPWVDTVFGFDAAAELRRRSAPDKLTTAGAEGGDVSLTHLPFTGADVLRPLAMATNPAAERLKALVDDCASFLQGTEFDPVRLLGNNLPGEK